MIPVTAIIPTRNEESNIERCLSAIQGFVQNIFVIDSESTDQTATLAKQYADGVYELPYDHTRIIPWIFQWGLDNLPIQTEWVLLLEADQTLTNELKEELAELFARPVIRENAFYIRRKQIFRGKWIRFGGYGSKYLLKLFRRATGELDPKEQDTRVYVKGEVGKLKSPLVEENEKEESILFYLQKHLRYADAFAMEEFERRRNGFEFKYQPAWFASPDHRTLRMKSAYYRMPLYFRPFLYFCYRYFFLLGFLDGKVGFLFHFLQSFWFRLVIDARLEE
ncbi:MAG TPA: glycosyltransferase family 2 protein, partial [Acidobacteriota bacterium]